MAGQRIGYVRVSTFDQNPERPRDMKQIVLLNVDIIVQGLAGMPIDCDITLAARCPTIPIRGVRQKPPCCIFNARLNKCKIRLKMLRSAI